MSVIADLDRAFTVKKDIQEQLQRLHRSWGLADQDRRAEIREASARLVKERDDIQQRIQHLAQEKRRLFEEMAALKQDAGWWKGRKQEAIRSLQHKKSEKQDLYDSMDSLKQAIDRLHFYPGMHPMDFVALKNEKGRLLSEKRGLAGQIQMIKLSMNPYQRQADEAQRHLNDIYEKVNAIRSALFP